MSRHPYNPWGSPDGPPDDVEREPDPSPLVTHLRSLAAAERARDARDGVCAHCGTGLDREAADVGVGVILGPRSCPGCGWTDARDGDCLACGGTGVGLGLDPCDSCQGGAL